MESNPSLLQEKKHVSQKPTEHLLLDCKISGFRDRGEEHRQTAVILSEDAKPTVSQNFNSSVALHWGIYIICIYIYKDASGFFCSLRSNLVKTKKIKRNLPVNIPSSQFHFRVHVAQVGPIPRRKSSAKTRPYPECQAKPPAPGYRVI